MKGAGNEEAGRTGWRTGVNDGSLAGAEEASL
jgi:hypothetical protein